MNIRTIVIVAGLAALAGGCAETPRQYEDRGYQQGYPVYRENDSYEGYYYVRVVYIDGDPWYVDDYRRARPIPRHLHSHFRNSSWTRSLPPRFSQDSGVRDGYPLSRIVYINDVPHHVDNDRRARPLSTKLRSRFSYGTVVPGNERGRGIGEREEQPAYGRERERRGAQIFGPESMPRPAVTQEPVREERGRQTPPIVRDLRPAPAGQTGQRPAERGERGDAQRAMPNNDGRSGNDGQRAGTGRVPSPAGNEKLRGRVQSPGMPAQAVGEKQRADSASEKQKEKGKGRGWDRDDEEGTGEGARK
ncbi:MAG: hypothetical protein K0M58_02165 [Thiobacillus sp.]|nr:hypothetical protein [Thiobacillus sp.]